jgi:hypothetical protein
VNDETGAVSRTQSELPAASSLHALAGIGKLQSIARERSPAQIRERFAIDRDLLILCDRAETEPVC